LYIINALCLGVYFVMQVLLVANTLQDRWPLGDLAFGAFFFIVGQVILYVFGARICEGVGHYLDGLFFATVCNLLGVMMVYKYWDSITKEDLEFSVGTKQGNWDVKDALLDPSSAVDDQRASFYGASGGRDYDASSMTLDYAPQLPAHFHQHPAMPQQQQQPQHQGYGHQQSYSQSHQHSSSRDRLSGYGQLNESGESYGDIRRQLPSYDDYSDAQPSRLRSRDGLGQREREYAY